MEERSQPPEADAEQRVEPIEAAYEGDYHRLTTSRQTS